MTSTAVLQPEPAPIIACTVCRDVQNFDLLIEDMETECGESWGDLSFQDAALFLRHAESETLEFIAVAIDQEDEDDVQIIAEIIKSAKEKGVRVLLIAEEVSPIALHQLLRLGAEEFVPYPLPDGALHDAIERMRQAAQRPPEADVPEDMKPALTATGDRDGVILPVHGMSGGAGASTFAVNLAWELANIDPKDPPRVCLIDLDLQFGTASTYLDLPRREAVLELLQNTESMDSESFMQALLTYNERLNVLTSPSDLIPLDLITPEDVQKLIETAAANFDYVVVDMPSTIVMWTETVLNAAHVYFATLELDLRSAQNTLRMIRALKSEQLPYEKLRFVLNRAPKFTDLSGKSRVKRLAESLDIQIEVLMPDGGKQVMQANDNGETLAESAAKNPLRKEVLKLANSVHELNQSVENG